MPWTARPSAGPAPRAPHLIAAFDHTAGTVLGQVATAAKSNELPAARDLLGLFDLNEVVVTVDALHTQHDTAKLIVAGGGDYVFTVKSNRGTVVPAAGGAVHLRVAS